MVKVPYIYTGPASVIRLSHSEDHPLILPEGHRFPFRKYELVRQQLEYEGVVRKEQLFAPEFIDDETITLTHSPAYWQAAKNLELSDREFRKIGFPKEKRLITRSLSSVSGTLRVAENALQDGAGMNLAGGTHHAFFDRGEGFSLLNDIGIAANHLLHKGWIKKVLIIDLDVHQGNGSASLFQQDPRVFTFSMHGKHNYPFKKEASDLDVELDNETGDEHYLSILKSHVPRLLEEQQADLVFYLAGVDVLTTDKLGKLALSPRGCYLRDQWVISHCRQRNLPLVVVMGGGYSPDYKTIVNAHSQTFKLALEYYDTHQFFI